MKKALFLMIVLGALIGCSSPEKSAQKLIVKHLKETLNDWKSYESVSFGVLDSAYTSVLENDHFIVAHHRCDSLLKSAKEYTEKMISASNQWEIVSYKNRVESDLSMAKNYSNLAHHIDSMFVPEFKGWEMIHAYRANNSLGAKIIVKEKYIFDPEITKIIKTEKVDRN